MSLGDAIMGLMYGNPMQQVANMGQPGPQGSPPAAGGAPGAQGGPAGGNAPQGAPAAQAQPQAYQSPPDLASMYMRLYQQDRSANEFDRGLALMAGGFKGPPGGAQTIMNSVAPAQDPGAFLQNFLTIRQQQQMQASRPALINALGGGAPGGAGGAAGAPGGGMDPNVLNALPYDELMKLYNERVQTGIQTQQKQTEAKQADVLEAQTKAPSALTQMGEMDKAATDIKTALDADGKTPVLKNIVGTDKAAAFNGIINASQDPGWMASNQQRFQEWMADLTPQEQAVAMKMRQLNGQVYGEAFTSTGSRRTQTEVANIKAGLSPLTNLNQSYDDYSKQFDTFQGTLHKGMGNTKGAAGMLNDPDLSDYDYEKNVSSLYKPGGALFVPGQGARAAPATIQSPGDIANLAHGRAFIIPGGPDKGKIDYRP